MATWTTREGQAIAVRDLSDAHLANCIRFLTQRFYDILDDGYAGVSSLSGDMATYYALGDLDSLERAGPAGCWPIYADLVAEAARRAACRARSRGGANV